MLTIKGISQEIAFPATIKAVDGQLAAEAKIAINRQDFKISYPGKPDNLIQDNVEITIKAES